MKVYILILFLVISCKKEYPKNIHIKIECYVLREGDTNLLCKRCIPLDNRKVGVVTLTDYKLIVHSSRVVYTGQKYEDEKLLKPYKGVE